MKNFESTQEGSKTGLTPGFDDAPKGVIAREPGGRVTEIIETQTGKLPWVSWVGLATWSVAASTAVSVLREEDRRLSGFIRSLAPCFLLMGVYNKLVRIEEKMTEQHAKMPPPVTDVPSSTAYLS